MSFSSFFGISKQKHTQQEDRLKYNPSKQGTPGFTIVELVIVVTILVVLGALGFGHYSNNIIAARDASRARDLTSIYGQLQTTKLKEGAYPKPNSSIGLIGSGGITVGYQGIIGDQLLQKLTIYNKKTDSKTGKYYTYIQNAPGQLAEVGAFFEESGNDRKMSLLGVSDVSAANYTKLYPGTIGNPIGIILSRTTYEPLQETTSSNTVISTLATANTHSIYGSCLTGGRTALLSLAAAQTNSYLDCFKSSAPALPGSW